MRSLSQPSFLSTAVGELGIAVLDLRTERVGAFGQQVDLALRAVRQRLLALHTEAGAERAAAVHHMQVGVVERVRAGMPQLRRAPARPWQPVVVAADAGNILRRAQRHQIELLLVRHVRLQRSGDWPQ